MNDCLDILHSYFAAAVVVVNDSIHIRSTQSHFPLTTVHWILRMDRDLVDCSHNFSIGNRLQ